MLCVFFQCVLLCIVDKGKERVLAVLKEESSEGGILPVGHLLGVVPLELELDLDDVSAKVAVEGAILLLNLRLFEDGVHDDSQVLLAQLFIVKND